MAKFEPDSVRSAKIARAASSPRRAGELCRVAPGRYAPVVRRDRCEGKADCAVVCPHNVFEVRRIEEADFTSLSLIGRMKSIAHGRLTAYTPRADACQACGLCVAACPERAIELAELAAGGAS